jgi:hypothetical protein
VLVQCLRHSDASSSSPTSAAVSRFPCTI